MDHQQHSTGAQWLARLLAQRGARHITTVDDAAAQPLYRALAEAGIRRVPARHAGCAGYIAQGMARVSGHAGVCVVPSGAAVADLLPALADAHADAVPLVALIVTRGTPSVHTGWLVDRITRIHFDLHDAEALSDLVPEAFRVAEHERAGPVAVQLPEALLRAPAACAAPGVVALSA